MIQENLDEELTLQEDPIGVQNFLTDIDNNCYFLEDRVRMLCNYCRRQYKHREGWIFCINDCENEK